MPTRGRSRGRLGRSALVLLACLAVVGGVFVLFNRGVGPLPDPEGCQARVGGAVVDLSTEQAENATTIVAVAVRRGLPARAASIALATATATRWACSSSGRRRGGARPSRSKTRTTRSTRSTTRW